MTEFSSYLCVKYVLIGYLVFQDLSSIIYTLVYAFFSSLILDRYYNRHKKILLEIVTDKKFQELPGSILRILQWSILNIKWMEKHWEFKLNEFNLNDSLS